ncbi:MAG: outer membrane lipoprotein carrier protein LolA [Fulvivirga sp.]
MSKILNTKSPLRLLVISLLVILMAGFQAQENGFTRMENVERFRNGIKEMAARTHSITASFKQDKYLSILSGAVESSGTMLFKKPDLLKWAYDKPYQYAILLDGERIQINDEGKVNSFGVTNSKIFQELNELIINSVQGNILQGDRFDITYLENEQLYLTKLVPKQEQFRKYVSRIDVYFEKKNFTVQKLQLYESETDYTCITFQHKEINTPIPDDEFSFE